MCDPCCSPCGPCPSPCGPCGPCGPCSPCDPCCAPFEPRACRSRELRCGIMYTTCDCIKRNGLQDRCPRSLCQGRAACMCFPVPNCCPASFPLRYANMTMGVNNRRMRCKETAALCARACGGCAPCGPSCGPCGPCGPSCSPCCDTACCGASNPPCGAPAPIPCPPAPGCCPPIVEAGVPNPCVWNCNNTPPTYPCGF
ncbi:PREDICTED: keratin-associated protein 5-9-like isoform X4 [Bactrocera latifrons]|uniref:keratin-associated protein 5-9-like isoform X4 n=1 Tax=Bactrocera latifrons TaxID=174628 RepID=UPI0008DD99CA|nr:PREDICTED: keratin-associated protein 5-9-like isoform X4 [Bactrocera latifrons]